MATILVHISLLAYTAGAAAYLTWLVKPDAKWVRIGRLLLLAGMVLHFGAFLAPSDGGVAAIGFGKESWKGGQLFSLLAAITVAAYPNGGGAYTVAAENLGRLPALLAASALFLDYVLNVAVAISAGVGAIVSAQPALLPYTLSICLTILLVVTIVSFDGPVRRVVTTVRIQARTTPAAASPP